MKALQVWLPHLGYSVGLSGVARDIRRAYEAWTPPPDVMFLLPGLEEPAGWSQKVHSADHTFGAIGAEYEETVAIGHVGANGIIFAPLERALHGHDVGSLLTRWLNLELTEARITAPFPIEATIPDLEGGRIVRDDRGIRYTIKTVAAEGQVLPISVLSSTDDKREIEFRWPPERDWPGSVYPDAESTEASHSVDDDRAAVLIRWPPPFDRLFGHLSAFDVLQAFSRMRSIAQLPDQTRALSDAKTMASGYVSDGFSTRLRASFLPLALQVNRPGEPLLSFWEGLGIHARTFEEALKSPKLIELVPVTRVWGGIGLLWALLIDRLEAALAVRTCACGTILRGRRKVCGPADNVDCYRARRNKTKRQSRGRSRPARST